MSYKYPDCATCTSAEIEEWIANVESILQKNIENHSPQKTIEMFQKQLDDLHADLILKKQEETKEEMKQLLTRLLEIVESK